MRKKNEIHCSTRIELASLEPRPYRVAAFPAHAHEPTRPAVQACSMRAVQRPGPDRQRWDRLVVARKYIVLSIATKIVPAGPVRGILQGGHQVFSTILMYTEKRGRGTILVAIESIDCKATARVAVPCEQALLVLWQSSCSVAKPFSPICVLLDVSFAYFSLVLRILTPSFSTTNKPIQKSSLPNTEWVHNTRTYIWNHTSLHTHTIIYMTSCPARRCSGICAPLNFVASLLWVRSSSSLRSCAWLRSTLSVRSSAPLNFDASLLWLRWASSLPDRSLNPQITPLILRNFVLLWSSAGLKKRPFSNGRT